MNINIVFVANVFHLFKSVVFVHKWSGWRNASFRKCPTSVGTRESSELYGQVYTLLLNNNNEYRFKQVLISYNKNKIRNMFY